MNNEHSLILLCKHIPPDNTGDVITGAAFALGCDGVMLPQQPEGRPLSLSMIIDAPSLESLKQFLWYVMLHHPGLVDRIEDLQEDE